MANDKKGSPVRTGDIVSVDFRVAAASNSTGDATNNLTLETVEDQGGYKPRLAVNSKLVTKKADSKDKVPLEPTPGSTPKVVPNLEAGVNETPEPGDPIPGALGKGGVASPPRGDNAGFREPSASIGDGILTGNKGVPEETLPADQREVEAHGGPGDVVGKGEAEPIRQEPDGRQVNVRDLSTPVNVRDDAPAGDKVAATESFEAVRDRATEDIPREHVNTGDAEIDAAAKASGERDLGQAPDAFGNEKEQKNAEGNQPAGKEGSASSQSVASSQDGDHEMVDGEAEKPKKMTAKERRQAEAKLIEENTAEELRDLAQELDVPHSGTKAELAERIVAAREENEYGGQS